MNGNLDLTCLTVIPRRIPWTSGGRHVGEHSVAPPRDKKSKIVVESIFVNQEEGIQRWSSAAAHDQHSS